MEQEAYLQMRNFFAIQEYGRIVHAMSNEKPDLKEGGTQMTKPDRLRPRVLLGLVK